MIFSPSIILEGASEAADWIPFAKSMLNSMDSDGTRNSSPQDKITIVVSLHEGNARIYIRAEYPKGGLFVGQPYDDEHPAGWGFLAGNIENEEVGYKGIEAINDNRAVIFSREFSNSGWEFKRYPEYATSYPAEVVYGNLDWTSKDGETVLTWKGINTYSYAAVPNQDNLQWSENCCSAVPPETDWYSGLAYPGVILTAGAVCSDQTAYGPFVVDSPAGGVLTGLFAFSDAIFEGGKELTRIRTPFGEDGNNTTGVMGAAMHTTEAGGVYVAAVVASVNVFAGTVREALYIADYNNLSDFKVITNGFQDYISDTYIDNSNLNSWAFDSTGKKAVVVRRYQGTTAAYTGKVVHELTINDDHSISIADLWKESDSGMLAKQDWQFSWGLDEHAIIKGEGASVVAVGYDSNDLLRYALVGGDVKQDQWIGNNTSGVCDKTYWYTNTDINMSLLFSNVPTGSGGNIVIEEAVSKTVDFEEKDANPPYWTTLTTSNNDCIPLFIDCRRDIFVGQRIRIDRSTFRIDQQAAGLPYVNSSFSDPEDFFQHSTTIEIWIEGILAYQSEAYIERREPGDCSDFTGEDPSRGQPICFPTSILTQPDVNGGIIGNITTKSDFISSFAQVQTKGNFGDSGFDIMVSARHKHSTADVICFLARWNGVELVDMQELDSLLSLEGNGFLSKTGKL